MARNESLKLEIRESESLRILKLRIRESGFANPNLKDSFRGFVSWKFFFQITRFVSFRKDSYTNPASLLFRYWSKFRSGEHLVNLLVDFAVSSMKHNYFKQISTLFFDNIFILIKFFPVISVQTWIFAGWHRSACNPAQSPRLESKIIFEAFVKKLDQNNRSVEGYHFTFKAEFRETIT
jgi:hypothetical protein